MATLEVHVVTPEREVWSGTAQMVVAHGVEGDVGILAGHAPLLIRLANAPLRIQREDGFMNVTCGDDGTRVDVLASQAGDVAEAEAGH